MDKNQSEPTYYCGQSLDDFHTGYKHWHGYVALFVCFLGIIANSLNIIVLTRKEMRSPTNAILTGLAVADLAVMIDYMPYACHEFIFAEINSREEQLTYSWAWFVKFHSIFGQICHTISIWLTITLAVWRYIAVGYPQKNRIWCGMQTTLTTITTSYVVCPLIVIPPLYLAFSIAPVVEVLDMHGNKLKVQSSTIEFFESIENSSRSENVTVATAKSFNPTPFEGRNVTLYKIVVSQLAINHPSLLKSTNLIYGVLIKLVPCVALTILSIRLIAALLEAKRRRKLLTSSKVNGITEIVNGKSVQKSRKNSKTLEKEKQTDRTTKMLLAVLLLFLITEFPQGILGLLSAILGDAFFEQCYLKLGDLMDILALINSGINFILYCSMSRQFRSTFTLLFRPKIFDKWLPVVGQDDEEETRARPENWNSRGGGGGGNKNFMTTQVTNV